jgi:hypothetical protein
MNLTSLLASKVGEVPAAKEGEEVKNAVKFDVSS